jgi:hypothetical protein
MYAPSSSTRRIRAVLTVLIVNSKKAVVATVVLGSTIITIYYYYHDHDVRMCAAVHWSGAYAAARKPRADTLSKATLLCERAARGWIIVCLLLACCCHKLIQLRRAATGEHGTGEAQEHRSYTQSRD